MDVRERRDDDDDDDGRERRRRGTKDANAVEAKGRATGTAESGTAEKTGETDRGVRLRQSVDRVRGVRAGGDVYSAKDSGGARFREAGGRGVFRGDQRDDGGVRGHVAEDGRGKGVRDGAARHGRRHRGGGDDEGYGLDFKGAGARDERGDGTFKGAHGG